MQESELSNCEIKLKLFPFTIVFTISLIFFVFTLIPPQVNIKTMRNVFRYYISRPTRRKKYFRKF